MASRSAHDSATRAQVIAPKVFGATNEQIEQQTVIKSRTISAIYDGAIQRCFDPKAEHPRLKRRSRRFSVKLEQIAMVKRRHALMQLQKLEEFQL